jgi:tyrosyl-tRNA synthetase
MGHTAVLIVCDFTAQVGDPSEAAGTRRGLSADEVRGNVENLLPVVEHLLLSDHLEVRYNSEWLGSMDMHDVLELTSEFTVARIMDREDFSTRWEGNEPISMIEFMYPLLQGSDSVAVEADVEIGGTDQLAVEADVEIGGTDQLWNLLVGRDLQERRGQTGQVVVTVPLLVGTDGVKKMSQSFGNYVSVRASADDMFGKVMSIPDEAMSDWYRLAAFAGRNEVTEIEAGLGDGSLHPGEAKRELGRRIVGRYWGEEGAAAAEASFDRLFRAKEVPEDVPEHSASKAMTEKGQLSLPRFLEDAQLVSSRSEARRLIAEGAVKIDGEQMSDEYVDPSIVEGRPVIQVGKRRFMRVVP